MREGVGMEGVGGRATSDYRLARVRCALCGAITGIIKDAVFKGRDGRAWLKTNTPVPRSLVLPTLKTGAWVGLS